MRGILLSEAYYGRQRELAECERLLDAVVDGVRSRGMKYNPNASPELEKVRRILAGFFNFEEACIFWSTNSAVAGAFTVPVTSVLNEWDYQTESWRGGIRWKNSGKKYLVIQVNNGLLLDKSFGGKHILAVLLHEIGHNFYLTEYAKVVRKVNFIFVIIKSLMDAMVTASSSNPEEALGHLGNAARAALLRPATRLFSRQKGDFNLISGAAGTVFGAIFQVFGSLVGLLRIPLTVIVSPVLFVQSLVDFLISSVFLQHYDDEVFADSFATSYGYGKELAEVTRGMMKGSNVKITLSAVRDTPIETVLAFPSAMASAICWLGDPHPSSIQRVVNVRDNLKHELAANGHLLGPRTRKALEKELAEVDEMVQTAVKLEREGSLTGFSAWLKDCLHGQARSAEDDDKRNKVLHHGWDRHWMKQVRTD